MRPGSKKGSRENEVIFPTLPKFNRCMRKLHVLPLPPQQQWGLSKENHHVPDWWLIPRAPLLFIGPGTSSPARGLRGFLNPWGGGCKLVIFLYFCPPLPSPKMNSSHQGSLYSKNILYQEKYGMWNL